MDLIAAKRVKEILATKELTDTVRLRTLGHAAIESTYFTSPLWLDDFNGSGIVYSEGVYENATPSTKHHIPGREVGKGTPYCHFPTIEDWVNAFIKVLHSNRGGKGAPIDAIPMEDYVLRLSANHYFIGIIEGEETQEQAQEREAAQYLKNLKSAIGHMMVV